MKFPSYLLLTIFIFTFVGINGQSPDYTYEFNKNGELVKGTPSLLRSGNSIGIKIDFDLASFRSEERRVGKECRSRWSPYH